MKLFISGTDTGVGKTWVSAVIAHKALQDGLSVGYYKPIQTGSALAAPEDPVFMRSVLDDRVAVYHNYVFEPAVTPSVADVNGSIDLDVIAEDIIHYSKQHDLLLIEGAGGLMVPTTPKHLMIDLIEMLDIPTVLVAHSRLGTINHTLLSIQALQSRNIPVAGLIVNYYPQNNLYSAPLAVQSLIPTLKQHLPTEIPLATCVETENGLPMALDLKDFSPWKQLAPVR